MQLFLYTRLKIKSCLRPLWSLFKYVADSTSYGLQNANDIKLEKWNKSQHQNTIFYNNIKIFNSLPIEIKECSNINKMKNLLREYCINNY